MLGLGWEMRPVIRKLKSAMITRSFCHVLSWSGSSLEITEPAHGLTRARETPLVPRVHRLLQTLLK